MKKHINGILFAVAVIAAATGIYFFVLKTSADLTLKIIFSCAVLLLALIVAIFASAVTKDKKMRSVVKAIGSIDTEGIAIYEDNEFVYANRRYLRIEEKTGKNIFREVRDLKAVEGYEITAETSGNGKTEFLIITIKEKTDPPDITDEIADTGDIDQPVPDESPETETQINNE